MITSAISTTMTPFSLAVKLPKSPTCRFIRSVVRGPCVVSRKHQERYIYRHSLDEGIGSLTVGIVMRASCSTIQNTGHQWISMNMKALTRKEPDRVNCRLQMSVLHELCYSSSHPEYQWCEQGHGGCAARKEAFLKVPYWNPSAD